MLNYESPQMKYPVQKGLISIIVPIYNDEIYIKECLDSILAQTFANWEAILVNDGSTDCTGKIIDEYAKKDLRFIAIHKQNQGTLLARKTGLENSKGEFIANIDHDDAYHPQFLEKMYAKITEIDADFVWCKCQIAYKENPTYYKTDYKWSADVCENIAMALMRGQGMGYGTWDKLIKREIYAKVRFPDIHLVIGEDPVQIFQVAYHSKSAAFVPENLYVHKTGGATASPKPFSNVVAAILMKKTLEILFDGKIPCNIEKAFYSRVYFFTTYNYFCLEKKTRAQFKDEIESFLPGLIAADKKLNFKRICVFFARKGIEFPIRLREFIIKLVQYVIRSR